MFENAILLPSLPSIGIAEIIIVLVVAIVAYFLVFNNFEKHLPVTRRILKLGIVVGTLVILGVLFGWYVYWGVIAIMTIGQIVLHGWYFPKKGINGLTAEPYDQYLATIQTMKGRNKSQVDKEKSA